MRYSRAFATVLAISFTTLAILLLAAAFLPFAKLKPLADSLMSDGDFKSLSEDNAFVYRILLGSSGMLLFGAVYLIGFGHIQEVQFWLTRLRTDFLRFLRIPKLEKADRIPLIALILIVGMATVFRLVAIHDMMAHDESYTFIAFGSGSLFNAITNYHLPNNHILNSVLICISTFLFGIEPWAIRLPALLAGLLSVMACYALAAAIYDKHTALASALAVSILPGAIAYSTSARGYTLVALFTLLTLWLADYVRKDKNWFAWLLLILFSAMGFYAVPVMLIPFGIVFVWLFWENLITDPEPYASRMDFLKYWLIAGISTAILVFLLYAPIFIYSGADKVFLNYWVRPEVWNGYLGSLPDRAAAVWREWGGGMSPIWTMAFISGFLLSLLLHRRIARQRFPLQIAAFLWVATIILIQRPIAVEKIWMFLQAPFMIWAAAGYIGLVKDIRLKFAGNLSLATLTIGMVMAIILFNSGQKITSLPGRWAEIGPVEKTVLFIKDIMGSNDRIIIDAPYDAASWYYSRLHGITENHFDKRLTFDRLFVIVSRSDDQTVDSVLHNRGPDFDLVNLEMGRLIANFQNLDIYEVPHR